MKKLLQLAMLAGLALILRAPAGACDIPANVRIISADQCETWRWFSGAWEVADKRMWVWAQLESFMFGQPSRFRPRELPEVVLEEHPGEYFWDPRYQGYVYGSFWSLEQPPRIHYAAETKHVLSHETDHFRWWIERERFGIEAWVNVGHLNKHDPYFGMGEKLNSFFYCPFPGWGSCSLEP